MLSMGWVAAVAVAVVEERSVLVLDVRRSDLLPHLRKRAEHPEQLANHMRGVRGLACASTRLGSARCVGLAWSAESCAEHE